LVSDNRARRYWRTWDVAVGFKESEPPNKGELAEERPPMARISTSKDCECVVGPWHGLFIAAYVTELEGVFYGYAKIFEHQPQDPWCPDALMKVASPSCPCPAEALDTAGERAFGAIDDMLAGAQDYLWRQLAFRTAQRMRAVGGDL
jgi:hypothetical protein